jgi:hypothetical protein
MTVGWVIEREIGGRPCWWFADGVNRVGGWTTDSSLATRFGRKEDGEKVGNMLCLEFAAVTAHSWSS